MILSMQDVLYSPTRDGEWPDVERPACPIAFVIDGEVVYAHGFCPEIGDNIFLANPTYSSRTDNVDGVDVEVVIATVGDTSTEMILSEELTAILLSEPVAAPITRETSLYVEVGWLYDENGFYSFKTIDGESKRVNGMLQEV